MESTADIFTELPCLGDLENPGQLPIQGVLRGTNDYVLRIFTIHIIYVFRVNESISDIPTELPCSGDLENPGQLQDKKELMILSFTILIFFTSHVFEDPFLTFLQSYHVSVASQIQVNFRFKRFSEVGTDYCVL